MTPAEVREIRKKLGLTQLALAEIVGVSRRTVEHWEAGTRNISKPAARLIKQMEK